MSSGDFILRIAILVTLYLSILTISIAVFATAYVSH